MIQQPMMSPQGRPPQGKPRQGIAQINPNVPMQTQLNQFSKLPPQQLEGRKNESFLAAIAAEQQAAKAEAAQREKLMSENPELATDEKIIDRLRQSTIASMMPPTNPMPNVMDKAEGVAGVLQNKAANRKRSMNKIASAGLPATGKPPMKNMASGGILGYKDGGTVTEADIDQWLENNPRVFPEATSDKRRAFARKVLLRERPAKLKEERTTLSQSTPVTAEEREAFKKANPRVFPKATDERMDAIIQKETYGKRDLTGNTATDISTMDLEASVIADAERLKEETATARAEALPSQVAQEVESARVEALAPVKPSTVYDEDTDSFMPITGPATTTTVNPDPNAPAGAAAGAVPTIEQMMQKDYTAGVGDDQLSEALGSDFIAGIEGRANVNPMDQQMGEEGRLDARFNPDDRVGKLGERQQKRMQDYLTERESPERQNYLKRMAMYNSMGKGGLGSIVGGMNRGLQNYERAQDQGKSSGLGALTALEDTDINRKTNVVQDSTSAAATLGDRIARQQDSAVASQIAVSSTDLNAAKQDVKNAFDRDVQIAGMSAKQYANELSAEMNLLIRDANSVQALAAIQRQLNDAVATVEENINNKYTQSRINSAKDKLDDAAKERLRTGEPPESKEEEFLRDYEAYRKALNEQIGVDTLRATIAKKQKDISGSAVLPSSAQTEFEAIAAE